MLPLRHKISLLALLCILIGTLFCAPVMAGVIDDVTADAANYQGAFVPGNLVDGDPATAWVGGGKGIGPGKWIELSFPALVKLEALHIFNGNQKRGQFGKYRRVVRGVILYPDGTRQKFTLKPDGSVQIISLQPKDAAFIKIVITGVFPGSKDKSMGKARVSLSEIAVYGTLATAESEKASEEAVKKVAVVPEEKEVAPKSKAKPTPVPAVTSAPKSKPESKPIPKPKVKPVSKSKPALKLKSKPKVKSDLKPKPQTVVKKPASKKEAVKPAPKKVKSVAKPKKQSKKVRPAVHAPVTFMRTAKPIAADAPLEVGEINPWLDLEFVAQIKRYFALLTTLHDSYPDVFSASLRDRERKAFVRLQDDMRSKKEFGQHHIAMLEHIGLNFDKPKEIGGSVSVRVHGPFRYYLEKKGYEISVDTTFSFVKEGGVWLIQGVQDH